MGLSLIVGSTVSKKTEAIYDRLIRLSMEKPNEQFIIIVPDQASLTVQEAIVNRHPNKAVSNIDILTFSRLAYHVFADEGEKLPEVLDEMGKLILLRLVTLRKQSELTVLKKSIHRIGMLGELKSVISELVQYNVTPEDLKKQAEALGAHPALQTKCRDIAIIYEAFMAAVHEKHELVEERVVRLGDCIQNWKGLGTTTFVFDGFTGFTPPQYGILREMISKCPEVIVGVTMGEGEKFQSHKEPENLFYMSAHMREKLGEMAVALGKQVSEEWISERGEKSPEIFHIEKNLYRFPQAKFEGASDRVQVVAAKNRRNEIATVLHMILEDRRAGLRFRDIAVVTGEPEQDRTEFEAQFSAAGIPFFMDANRSVSENELCRFLMSALHAVRVDFSFDTVFAFAKNSLVEYKIRKTTANQADLLTVYERIAEAENFALVRGYRGRNAFEKEWTAVGRNFSEERFPIINETKTLALQGLFEFADAMKSARSVKERIGAIRRLFINYCVEEGLADSASKLQGESDLRTPAEQKVSMAVHAQILEFLNRLFTSFETLFGEEELDLKTMTDLLEVAVQSLTVSHVPPTKDRVVIGDLTRTRLGDIQKLYVLRANEGILPADHTGGGLLSDQDREILKEQKVQLAETAKEKTFFDRYYLYLLLTKPKDSLVVSYTISNAEGKQALPGDVVSGLRAMFPNLTEVRTKDNVLYEANTKNSALEVAGREASVLRTAVLRTGEGEPLRKEHLPDEKVRALSQWLEENSAFSDVEANLKKRHLDESVGEKLAEGLYSVDLRGSATQLELYAQCPYRHFLQHGLHLKEKDVFEVQNSDVGSMLHNSIDYYFRAAEELKKPWHGLDAAEEQQLLSGAVRQAIEETNNGIMNDSARNAYMQNRIERIAKRTLWALKKQWKAGSFTETRTEIEFGEGKALPPIRIDLGKGKQVILNGRIDRVDTEDEGSRVFVKIIDYKSSEKQIDYQKLQAGIQIQLPLYLSAVTRSEEVAGKQVIPVGMYYYAMLDPQVKRADISTATGTPEYAEKVDLEIFKNLKLNGLTNCEPEIAAKVDKGYEKSDIVKSLTKKMDKKTASSQDFEAIEEFSIQKARELGQSILSGDIPVRPYYSGEQDHACRFCPYASVCGITSRIPGYMKKKLKETTLDDIVGKEVQP